MIATSGGIGRGWLTPDSWEGKKEDDTEYLILRK